MGYREKKADTDTGGGKKRDAGQTKQLFTFLVTGYEILGGKKRNTKSVCRKKRNEKAGTKSKAVPVCP